jgi:cytosolic carboxypeptidase protein 5
MVARQPQDRPFKDSKSGIR